MDDVTNRAPLPARPAGAVDVTDSKGRKLRIERLDVMRELDLIEAAGDAAASNARWMSLATLACCVTWIDNLPQPFPTKKDEIRRYVGKVGSEGIAAVVKALGDDVPADVRAEEATAGN